MGTLRRFLLVFVGFSGLVINAAGFAQESERGALLYENYCHACHESVVHIRKDRKAQSTDEIILQVKRWAKHLNLRWRRDEILDVAGYLNQRFYKFNFEE